jgi:WD40 repeat protein
MIYLFIAVLASAISASLVNIILGWILPPVPQLRHILVVIAAITVFAGVAAWASSNENLDRQIANQATVPINPVSTATNTLSSQATLTIQNQDLTSDPAPQIASDMKQIFSDNATDVVVLGRFGRGVVNQIAWSPDGSTLAVATSTGVFLYNAETLQEQGYVLLGNATANQVVWSPDSTSIIAGSSIGLYFYNTQTLEQLNFIPTETAINSIALSTDGQTLISAGVDKRVRVWEVGSGQPPRTLATFQHDVRAVALSVDGFTVAVGGGKLVRLLNINSEELPLDLVEHLDEVISLTFSPDGSMLASGAKDGIAKIWNTDGQALHTLQGFNGGVGGIAFRSDTAAVAFTTGIVTTIWDLDEDQELARLNSPNGASVAYSPDGTKLVSGGIDGSLQLWGASHRQSLHAVENSSVTSIAFSPDGRLLASGLADDTVRLWNLDTNQQNQPLPILEGHVGDVLSVTFSPDGQILASGGEDSTVRLWDINNGQLFQAPLEIGAGKVLSLAFSPDGSMLAVGTEDSIVSLWNLKEAQPPQLLFGRGKILSLAFSPEGDMLVSGDNSGTVMLWGLNGDSREPLEHHSNVSGVAFSADGHLLAIGSGYLVYLYDVAKGFEPLKPIRLIDTSIVSLALSPDGNLIVIGGFSLKMRLLDVESGGIIHTLEGHDRGPIVAFNQAGNAIASAGKNGMILLWGLK